MGHYRAPPGHKEVAVLLSKTHTDTIAFLLMYNQGQKIKLHLSRNEEMRERTRTDSTEVAAKTEAP